MPFLAEGMAYSFACFGTSPYFVRSSECKPRVRVRAESAGGAEGAAALSSDLVSVNGSASLVRGKEEKRGVLFGGGGNGELESGVVEKKKKKKMVKGEVWREPEVLWDDGYGSKTVKDYLDVAKEMIKPDGGPPRWFCPVDCGRPITDAPVLLFLPGLDGFGMGLILHHKSLGRVFEVRCLHIPVDDRTPFEGLVKFVEETVRSEHASNPNKSIYLVGDSFGGCLALAVAARNPSVDLIVILINPATSFGRSQLQPLLPIFDALPDGLHTTVPYALSFIMGNPLKMATVDIDSRLPPSLRMEKLSANLTSLLPLLSVLADIIPKATLLWKLKLLKSGSAYTNSRLHAVKAEVLVLASGSDYMLPSSDEAKRLYSLLENCKVRYFKDNGHTLLLEDGISLLTVIKGTGKYRRSRRVNFISDYLPPSMKEYKYAFDEVAGYIKLASSSVMLSTMEDGKIVKGLAGVPEEGPVLLVGYHMLMGLELCPLVEAFIREKNVVVRGLAHPELFLGKTETPSSEFSFLDWVRVFGALPVSASNLFRLFETKSHILLYPGGAREALHLKGEEYKLFWPERQEFVRMATRFGATIVPFGVVGEDDIAELVLDYDDLMRIPVVNDYIRERTHNTVRIRDESSGEVANQQLFPPGLLPKVPGRFYYLFGKPIKTEGREDLLKDKEEAIQLYMQIKSEVERNINYLLRKREEDPYRGILDRLLYHALHPPLNEVPTFEP